MIVTFGICDLAGRPGTPARLERMIARRLLVRPHDVERQCETHVAFAAAGVAPARHLCRRSTRGRGLHTAFTGRIDNARDVMRDVEPLDRNCSGAHVLLHAYDAFGHDCANALIGDFAFAIWDASARRLLLGRDPLGVKTLYYTRDDDWLAFSTQLGPLLALRDGVPDVDEEYLGEYVAIGLSLQSRTPYRHISAVPPGCTLTFDRQGLTPRRYWNPDADVHTHAGTPADTIARFRTLFIDAVRATRQADGPVWSELSGGLDSSSIVSTAKLLERESPPIAPLETLTVVFDESVMSDERVWAHQVTAHCGHQPHYINGDAYGLFTSMEDGVGYWDEPSASIWDFTMLKRYGELVARANTVAVLNGIGAEAVVTCEFREPFYLSDLLRQRRWRDFGAALSKWQRAERKPLSNILLDYCVRPLFRPGTVRYSSGIDVLPSWLSTDAIRRLDLWRFVGRPCMPPRFSSAAIQWQYERLGRIQAFLTRGYLEKTVEVRYPFLHRPLVEFMLAAPWEHKLQPGRTKPILREAMRGILPEPIRTRTQAVSGGHASYLGVRREWPAIAALLDRPVLADLRLIDARELYRCAELVRHGHSPYLALFVSVLALELFLRRALGDPRLDRVAIGEPSREAARASC